MTEARLRELVRERFEAREHLADPAPPLDAGTLEELLGRPQGQPFRIEGLQPSQAAMLVVAQRKTGKTTFALNYARCLLTGEDFLGRFPVRAVTGSVAIINLEQSSEQLARWAHDHGIPRDRLYLANFRGTRNPLANLRDRKELVERLKEQGVESIIVDPFGRAFDGKDQNSSGEVGKWLADLDYFVRSEVGALDLLLTAHSGWSQSGRARGSSAVEDWADVIVRLTRDGHDSSVRYLEAEGRDVLVRENRIEFDAETRLMTLTDSGSQREDPHGRMMAVLVAPVLEAVKASPGINGMQLEVVLKERGFTFRKGEPGKVAQQAAKDGFLRFEIGQRSAKCYYSAKN